jgi:hypothetical protein
MESYQLHLPESAPEWIEALLAETHLTGDTRISAAVSLNPPIPCASGDVTPRTNRAPSARSRRGSNQSYFVPLEPVT